MKEEFLHYLWRNQLFSNFNELECETQQVEILHPGEHNNDSGPDFFNAKIRIGETIWAGNVEIHIASSDWKKHKHQHDEAYDNIILHVVGIDDEPVYRKNGDKIPTIEIKSPKNLHEQYIYLMQNKDWIPCERFIHKINEITLLQWKEALLIERLQEKASIIQKRFIQNQHNFEETFYQSLASNFGFKTNAFPFEQLAKSLPLNILAKQKDQLSLIEALLYGQAGLLQTENSDSYTLQLQKDYNHLKTKYSLQPINKSIWKYMRMRPANFPTIRIAQFATLIHQSTSLFSKILEAETINDYKQYFHLAPSEYWEDHYSFKKTSPKKIKNLGNEAFDNIAINTIVPTLFFYGKVKGQYEYIEKALDLLTKLKAENNKITKSWKALSLNIEQAFDSQALIQLKNVYCKNRRCLNCRIGNQVIKHTL